MGFLDRLLGRPEPSRRQQYANPSGSWSAGTRGTTGAEQDADERAIARYRYLLRTAPPETLEQAHAEAFAQLTPDQRRQVLTGLANGLPQAERATGDDPRSLARMATRAEMRQPGTLERVFGGSRGGFGMGAPGMGVGGMIAGTLLGSIAGTVIGSSIASAFLDDNDVDSGEGSDAADAGGDEGSAEAAGDFGGEGFGESPGGGYGGDFGGGFGGDFGGGDFGGGDF